MPDRTLLDAMAVQLIAAMRDPMKTGSSSGSQGSKVDATKAELPKPKAQGPVKRAALPDREITVRRAIEGVTTGKPDVRGMWRVEEGPHGELLFERREAI